MTLDYLRALGFTDSRNVPFTRAYVVRCSACDAMVIQGVPAHELGCQNDVRECLGCNELVPARARYCGACRS